jgi:hypothetical protein
MQEIQEQMVLREMVVRLEMLARQAIRVILERKEMQEIQEIQETMV